MNYKEYYKFLKNNIETLDFDSFANLINQTIKEHENGNEIWKNITIKVKVPIFAKDIWGKIKETNYKEDFIEQLSYTFNTILKKQKYNYNLSIEESTIIINIINKININRIVKKIFKVVLVLFIINTILYFKF